MGSDGADSSELATGEWNWSPYRGKSTTAPFLPVIQQILDAGRSAVDYRLQRLRMTGNSVLYRRELFPSSLGESDDRTIEFLLPGLREPESPSAVPRAASLKRRLKNDPSVSACSPSAVPPGSKKTVESDSGRVAAVLDDARPTGSGKGVREFPDLLYFESRENGSRATSSCKVWHRSNFVRSDASGSLLLAGLNALFLDPGIDLGAAVAIIAADLEGR